LDRELGIEGEELIGTSDVMEASSVGLGGDVDPGGDAGSSLLQQQQQR
jgi:hypothetical protein